MKLKNQIRTFQIKNLRAEDDGQGSKITGFAATFGTISRALFNPVIGQNGEVLAKGLKEKLEPGAFREAIQTSDVRALFNHDINFVLGRTASGTLRLAEDDIGLRFEIDIPDTQFAKDLMTLMKRGDINEMSFAFDIATGGVRREELDERFDLDVITKVSRLFDVSPVVFPAYPNTFAAVRSLDRLFKSGSEEDKALVQDIYKRLQGIVQQRTTPEGHETKGDAETNQNRSSEANTEGPETKDATEQLKRSLDVARRKLDLLEREVKVLF